VTTDRELEQVRRELEEQRAERGVVRDKLAFDPLDPSSREKLEYKLLALDRNIARIARNESEAA
jgi:hypothetical protein